MRPCIFGQSCGIHPHGVGVKDLEMVSDPEYKAWIKKQPCHLCGHAAKGTFRRYNEYKDTWETVEKSNAAHHTGDGVHSRHYSDHWLVPLCDYWCDPASNSCHHREAHRFTGKYRETFREAAKEYRRRYLEEMNNE